MAILTSSVDGKRTKAVVTAETTTPIYVGSKCVITAKPGAGGTMLAEATYSLPADVAAGTAVWFPWDAGASAIAAVQIVEFAVAVRFTAGAVAGVGEVAQ